jgi:hypothetical protein
MSQLGTIEEFVSRAASQVGFERERYIEANLPTVTSRLLLILFLGDLRAQVIFSSLLLHRMVDKLYSKKYVILCSWPGQADLYPFVDEYWSISDLHALKDLAQGAIGMNNQDSKFDVYARSLRRYFESVLIPEDFSKFYNKGLTKDYFHTFQDILVYYPNVPATNTQLHRRISSYPKSVFVFPARAGQTWHKKEIAFKFPKSFWIELCQGLLARGVTPVVCQNYATHEIDNHFGEKCIYVTDRNWCNVLSAMRTCRLVLDVCSGISKLAHLARVPAVVCDDRQRHFAMKDYETIELIGRTLPCRYVYTFPTMIESGHYEHVLEQVNNVVENYMPSVVEYDLPSPNESYVPVSYDIVKERKMKRLGLKFIKVERLMLDG